MHTIKMIATTIAFALGLQSTAFGATELLNPRDLSIQPTTGNGASFSSSSSADGRYVAFSSTSSDFVASDTNQRADIFVYDRTSGTVQRVSVSTAGAQANSDSTQPAISADGRIVAFVSMASNLVANDTNNGLDVFVHDRQTLATTRVSVSTVGAQATAGAALPDSVTPSITSSGRFVAFLSNATNLTSGLPNATNRVFVRDRQNSITTVVSVSSSGVLANQSSSEPMISADGVSVAFTSGATNLVASDTNGALDVFVRNRTAATTTRVSVNSSGVQGNGASSSPALNADGRYVAFKSSATNLTPTTTGHTVDIFLRDQQSSTTTLISTIPNPVDGGESAEPSISADGNIIAYSSITDDDFPAVIQIFVANRLASTVQQITFGPSTSSFDLSGSTEPAVSGNGRYVFFTSSAYNIINGDGNNQDDVFAFDNQTSTTSLVSASKVFSRTATGGGSTTESALSRDGRYAAFTSSAAVLTTGDSNGTEDIFVTDRTVASLKRVSINSSGEQGNDLSRAATISDDGKLIAFTSWASNLAPNNVAEQDIFVHNQETGITTMESVNASGAGGFSDSFNQAISGDGRFVAYSSLSSNLVAGEAFSESLDIFVRNRTTRAVELISKSTSGVIGNDVSSDPSISDNGRYVVFTSYASNFVSGDDFGSSDLFLRDRQAGTTTLVSVGFGGARANGESSFGVISGNGRYVAFTSTATNLVSGGSTAGLFIRDLQRGVNILVAAEGSNPSLSADGRFLAFSSSLANLVSGDTNNVEDIFVFDQLSGLIRRESLATDGSQGNAESILPAISADGRVIAFTSAASNFTADDNNGTYDVFARTRQIPVVVRINSGGGAFTDSQNHLWDADRAYNTGGTTTFTAAIAGTTDDTLYQTERWDPSTSPELQYGIGIPNGKYLVRLHFAENHSPSFVVGARVFDVNIEGVRTFENIDIFKEAGARTALVRSASVTVNDGRIEIAFFHQAQNPMVDAIEILGQ